MERQKKLIKLAIEGYKKKNEVSEGPDIFLQRLCQTIKKNKYAKLRSTQRPFYDVALFKISEKAKYKKPFVMRVDGIYFDKNNTLGDSEELNAPIFSSIDKSVGVVFISDFSRKIVEKFHHKMNLPYTIIHNSVDIDYFHPTGKNMRKQFGIEKNEIVFVTAAHWRRHKRLEETVKLFKLINKKFTGKYRLLVLGKEPDYHTDEKEIIFSGYIHHNDLPSYYRTGDFYLHLAWIEPCGNTQIEAMACGLPTLCMNNGGIGETVKAANGGIVSQADKQFEFEKVDYYNPPKPDYAMLLNDIEQLINQKDKFRNSIKREALDINIAAKQYVDFIKKVYL